MQDFIIIGAGLAGLTAAWRLHQKCSSAKIPLIEKARVGGQCVSVVSSGVAFDVGGHFCHNFEKLPDFFKPFNAECIDFEKNTYSIDSEGNCFHGMIQNFLPVQAAPEPDVSNLGKYLYSRFGQQIYSAFLLPYNEKLNVLPLEQCGIMQFAADRTPAKGTQSYNNFFKYPRRGGIGRLIDWLWLQVAPFVDIVFGECEVIDSANQTIRLKSGETYQYQKAVFDSSPIVAAMNAQAYSSCVHVINGFAEAHDHFTCFNDPAWIYIATRQTPVFRIGNYEICGAEQRNGMIPFYLESSLPVSEQDLYRFFAKWRLTATFRVPHAYPVTKLGFDLLKHERIAADADRNHYWIGRYGKDEWFSMSDTILDTIRVVDQYLS